jgi:hypothetical protein
MANRSDYTITTLSESVQQRDFAAGVNGTQAPFLFGGPLGPPNLRGRNTAYVSAEGNPVAPRPPQPPLTVNLSKISVSTTAYSATAENYQFLVNLDKISVGTTAYSASAENAIEYISPFLYMDFETSSSTVVSGNQGTYSYLTGTLRADGASGIPPRYDADSFSGSYSLEFYDNSDANTKNGWLTMGTPDENSEWGMLTGSWSLSFWYKPYTIGQYKSLFSFKDLDVAGGGYQFMLVVGDNTGSAGSGGPLGWYVSGNNDQWNFFENQTGDGALQPNEWKMITYVISGSNTDRPRLCEAYVNGISLGTPKNAFGQDTQFSYRYDSTRDIFFGPWFYNAGPNWEMNGKIDEVSFWDFSLNSGQVSALYNGGSGANAMTALTQSS